MRQNSREQNHIRGSNGDVQFFVPWAVGYFLYLFTGGAIS